MDRHVERVCCQDVFECTERMDEAIYRYGMIDPYECITQHPGFVRNCLQEEVVENAWLVYKGQYGRQAYDGPRHKKLRHVAYRQFAHFLYGILGMHNRHALPSCAVKLIRDTYPSDNNTYTGYIDV